MLNRLVRGAVLAQADAVVGEDEDHVRLLQGCEPERRAHVVREDEKRRGVGDDAAVQRHAVDDVAHRVLAHAEVHVVAAPLVETEVAVPFEIGVGGRREVRRAADQCRQAFDCAVEDLAGSDARRHRSVRR